MNNKLKLQAEKLVQKLQNDISTGKREICENYGQKEIRKFMDRINILPTGTLSYQEKWEIEQILYKVSDIN